MDQGPQSRAPRRAELGGRNVLRRRGRLAAATLASSCLVLGVLGAQAGSAAATHARHHSHHAFKQVNLVSDIPGRAQLLDPEVKNPWGIAFGPSTPLWVNNNFNPALANLCDTCIPKPADLLTKITLYAGANGKTPITKVPLEVTASSPTGIVFNASNSFKINQHNGNGRVAARFMFNEVYLNAAGDAPEGRVTGWAPNTDPTKAPPLSTTSTRARQPGDFPTGLALVPATVPRGPRLLVAGTADGRIHVYNSHFKETTRPGQFVDRRAVKSGEIPYNVMYLKGRVYVTYAGDRTSALTVFGVNGRWHKRLVTNGKLVGPWGMAIAPRHWGRFGGALLVGNVGDGKINAFNRHSGRFEGTLKNARGKAIANPGLWGIAFGNGVIGTPRTLIFAAGIGSAPGGLGDDGYEHGLVGRIKPVSHR
ncbi:MAG: hypothetical protein QOF53_1681 [Nocardioidaceae bacterium]|nr:hypothetical protein [Nocardioidaceae bacterium]